MRSFHPSFVLVSDEDALSRALTMPFGIYEKPTSLIVVERIKE